MRSCLFFFFLLFSLREVMAFPWPKATQNPQNPEFYTFYIEGQAMRLFNESHSRYFATGGLKLKKPYFYVDSNYTYSITENQHYFRPQEFYVELPAVDGKWFIGRRRVSWNPVEGFWNRSLWEPAYRDDALRPKWAGLTGVFRDFQYDGGKVTLFGSFLFVPDAMAPFESQNGLLVSHNPWFTPPPSGKIGVTAIYPHYLIHKPHWKDFLALSVGGLAEYKNFHFSYAYKPMNKIKVTSQVLLSLDEELKGNHKEGYAVEVPLNPVILNHHLLSGGFVFQSQPEYKKNQSINYSLKTSFTYNHPDKHIPQNDTWVFFPAQREWLVSAKGELHVLDPIEQTTLHLAYTHHFPIEEKPKSALSKALPDIEKQFFRTGLFQFSRAVSTGVRHHIKIDPKYSADIKARLIYNILHGYFLFSAHGELYYDKTFSFFISSDLLFSHFPFSAEQTQKNIGIYTNKSRVFGGIRYAF